MTTAEFYTPIHTNSFSVLASMLSNTTMVVGLGALTGFKYLNFSVMPTITKHWESSEDGSVYAKIFNSEFITFFGFGLLFLALTLYDDFNLFASLPAILAYGFIWTTVYLRSNSLMLPLWYSRQITRFTALTIFITLLTGYCMVSREKSRVDNSSVLRNI